MDNPENCPFERRETYLSFCDNSAMAVYMLLLVSSSTWHKLK